MKTFATLTAVSVLALAGAAFAQTTPPAPSQDPAPQTRPQAPSQGEQAQDDGEDRRDRRWSRADFDALTDARMAAIQAGLKLTPEQQRLWTPVEQALRAMADHRADRREERREARQERRTQRRDEARRDGDRMVQNLEERAQDLTQAAQRVTALSEAVKPFWASLTEDQKRLAPILLRQGRDGGWRMHAGMDRGGRRGGDRDGWRRHGGDHHPGRYHHHAGRYHGRMMDHDDDRR